LRIRIISTLRKVGFVFILIIIAFMLYIDVAVTSMPEFTKVKREYYYSKVVEFEGSGGKVRMIIEWQPPHGRLAVIHPGYIYGFAMRLVLISYNPSLPLLYRGVIVKVREVKFHTSQGNRVVIEAYESGIIVKNGSYYYWFRMSTWLKESIRASMNITAYGEVYLDVIYLTWLGIAKQEKEIIDIEFPMVIKCVTYRN